MITVKKKTIDKVEEDIQLHKLKGSKQEVDKKYKALLKRIVELEKEKSAILQIKKSVRAENIKSRSKISASEATAFILASDWHVEEYVDPATINDVNEYNLDICRSRIDYLFNNSVRLIEIARNDVKVKTLVLCLMGDFINGNIHEEMVETNLLPPIEASIFATNLIVAGIRHLLDKTGLKLIVVCMSGNHARITDRKRISTESGNSLEYFMYHIIAEKFTNNKRIQFVIEKGQHTYINIYNKVLRFSHGDGFRYQGGVGGIYIPANKAIAQWNKVRKADLDIFGHWHQRRDAGNFLCNGSVVGYNAYALKIRADFEPPKQTFFMIDSCGRKIGDDPIFLQEEKCKTTT